jgi:hypothetical protein
VSARYRIKQLFRYFSAIGFNLSHSSFGGFNRFFYGFLSGAITVVTATNSSGNISSLSITTLTDPAGL